MTPPREEEKKDRFPFMLAGEIEKKRPPGETRHFKITIYRKLCYNTKELTTRVSPVYSETYL